MKQRTQTAPHSPQTILRTVILVIAACLIHGVMQGIHDNYGIMMKGLMVSSSLSYAYLSFCIGVGALLYGIAQPFLGMLALRKSNVFVIMLGILFTAGGLILTPLCHDPVSMLLFFGIALPLGTTGLCFGIVMGAITPFLGEKQAAIVSGIVQASAGIGDALMSPTLQQLSDHFGIRVAMTSFAIPFIAMIPVALWLGKANREHREQKMQLSGEASGEPVQESLKEILSKAFQNRNYRLILLGFSTCGFNMSIIESHLYSQYIANGIPNATASLTLTVYGIATMIGAVASGYLGTRFKMKNVLGSCYALRVVISAGFLLLPVTTPFAFLATALLGMCGDATVPPTSGIVSREFGAEKMAVLYGFALIGHQVGAFLSASLGGLFVSHGLGYAPLWGINLALALMAATASFRIREQKKYI